MSRYRRLKNDGRTPAFIAMCEKEFFRPIGAATTWIFPGQFGELAAWARCVPRLCPPYACYDEPFYGRRLPSSTFTSACSVRLTGVGTPSASPVRTI